MAYPHEAPYRRHASDGSAHALAQGLGWFSVGLGLAQALAPHSFARFLGMEEHAGLIRAYGVRELATGVGILSQDDPTPWVWGRVAGDALDLATLAAGLRGDNPRQENAAMALMAVAEVTLLDVICARSLGADGGRSDRLPTMRDYRHRSGMPRPPEAMRGAAARDFEVPRDMRPPEALRATRAGDRVKRKDRRWTSRRTAPAPGKAEGDPRCHRATRPAARATRPTSGSWRWRGKKGRPTSGRWPTWWRRLPTAAAGGRWATTSSPSRRSGPKACTS